MARAIRYPTFDDYISAKNFKDGIKRCDEMLRKHPHDVQLLTTKLQLQAADGQDVKSTLEQLLAVEPPIRDIGQLFSIQNAAVQAQHNIWPRPRTVGPEVSKLWDNAVKTSTTSNMKLEILVQRYDSSVEANYMVDAQQALIQLKAVQPKNRVIYMAHAAVTQLTSTSKDDMQSRLALMLSKKAVTEKFNEEAELDCRVPGQIFALQSSTKDLESIKGTKFAESKQVYEATRDTTKKDTNGSSEIPETKDLSKVSPAEWLAAEVANLKARFAQLVESAASLDAMLDFAANTIRLLDTAIKSAPSARSRAKGDVCFIAISALVKAYEMSQQPSHLLVSAHLAEMLLRIDKHIHEARMILVFLFMRLGLGSLAIQYFDSLKIKEMQMDTVGHALFTDLSHVYPHRLPTGKKEESNPISRAKTATQVYQRCEQRLFESEMNVLSNGQTGMIFDLHELRDLLRSSITKRIIHLEIRRQARMLLSDCSWNTDDMGPGCVENWIETTDNRDFAATFDYGYNVEKALHGHRGKVPGREWILYALAADVAWCLASSKDEDSPLVDALPLLKELESDLPDLSQLSLSEGKSADTTMSDFDLLVGDLSYRALKLVILIKSKSAADDLDKAIADLEQAVSRLNITTLCSTVNNVTAGLREHYAAFDVLKVAAKVCEFGSKAEGVEKQAALLQLQQKITGDLKALRAHAEQQQRKGVTAKTVEAEMARSSEEIFAAVKTLGKDELDGFYGAVWAAAEEGWSGLGKLKM